MNDTTMILMIMMGIILILLEFMVLTIGIAMMVGLCFRRNHLQYRFEYED